MSNAKGKALKKKKTMESGVEYSQFNQGKKSPRYYAKERIRQGFRK